MQAIQRRYQNVVKDSTRQLQYNMILGRKLCVPSPSMHFFLDLVSGSHPFGSSQCALFPFARAEPVAIRVREQLPGLLAQDRALSVLRPRTREVAPGTLLCHCISQPANRPTDSAEFAFSPSPSTQADKLTNEPFSWIAPSGCDVLEVTRTRPRFRSYQLLIRVCVCVCVCLCVRACVCLCVRVCVVCVVQNSCT
jgi:hypothetical protein